LKPGTIVVTIALVAFAAVATVVGFFPLVIVIWLAVAFCLIKLKEEEADSATRRRKG
jgi:fatty acid desaturase